MRQLFLLALLASFLAPHAGVFAATGPDLSISANSIRFSSDKLYVGDDIRIYATVKNLGETDAVAQVVFYQGGIEVGTSQTISVIADGAGDDVFVDFTVPNGSFNIRAVVLSVEPRDTNDGNNSATTPLYRPIADEDRDGVEDEDDNCVEDENADQSDIDHDGKGDVCDADMDGDGVPNANDKYPTDSARSADSAPKAPVKETPKEEVKPVVTPAPVVAAPVASTSTVAVKETTEPKAEVAGVKVEDIPEGEVVAIADEKDTSGMLSLGLGAVKSSPDARFTYRQIDWRTYEFVATPEGDAGGETFGWDFGDGATSVQGSITHAFPRAGSYTVTLAVADKDGNVRSDAQVLEISFFHLDNPLVQLTLGLLLVILLGLLVFIVRLRKERV